VGIGSTRTLNVNFDYGCSKAFRADKSKRLLLYDGVFDRVEFASGR
jgi:hypothetical protein